MFTSKRINKRLLLKIKDEYKLELQTPETMRLYGSTKNLQAKQNKGEVAEVVLVQCNWEDNQYQQMSEVFYTFTPKTSFVIRWTK